MERKYVLSVLVQNNAGVLSRVSGLFSRRSYNISSLTVGETMDRTVSRMTIQIYGNEDDLEQVKKQLSKLEEVIKIADLKEDGSVLRELMLVKVSANDSNRSALIEICNVFRSRIIDLSPETATIEVCGEENKNNALLELLSEYGIIEIARTGTAGLMRGAEIL